MGSNSVSSSKGSTAINPFKTNKGMAKKVQESQKVISPRKLA